jgi:hypothetical protein
MKKRAITLQKLLPEYLEFWKTICNMETPSSDKNALNIQADFIEKFAVAHGFTVRRKSHDRAGDTMSIELAADSTLEPIALLAHMDTVHEKVLLVCLPLPRVRESYMAPEFLIVRAELLWRCLLCKHLPPVAKIAAPCD